MRVPKQRKGENLKKDFFKKTTLSEELPFLPSSEQDCVLHEIYSTMIRNGLNDSIAKEIILKILDQWIKAFWDKRFEIPNGDYMRYQIKILYSQIIQKVKDSKRSEDSFDIELLEYFGGKFAIIFVDAEGLKAVNDIFGHNTGDKYLKIIASILSPKNNPVLKSFIDEHSLNCDIFSAGGDEFFFVLNFPNWEEINDQSMENYRTESGSIINLPKEFLIKLQSSVEKINLIKALDINLKELERKLDRKIPKNFEWLAAAPGSYITFKISDFFKKLNKNGNASERIFNILGAIIDTVSLQTKKIKHKYKKSLRNSDDPELNIVAEILTRNEEMVKLIKENRLLKKEVARLNKQLQSFKKEA